jgi:NADH dehydrogenase [ubiquinone] 1 alpha subcomplex assembly factor 7
VSPPPDQGVGTALEGVLRERIRNRGPLSFRDYMDACLYHPEHGYYASGEVRTGRRGHFLTSPELDPAYGALWGRAFEELWEEGGAPSEFTVVEVGPGEGGFAAALLAAAAGRFADALRYVLVEPHRAVAERQRARLGGPRRAMWKAKLAEVAPVAAGVVFANEVLDNLPVHVLERRGGHVYEVHVTAAAGGLAEILLPISSAELADPAAWPAEGERSEVGIEAGAMVGAAARLVERGAAVFVDYGYTDAAAHPRGTVVAYSSAGADCSVVARPGERDITAHVDWGAVASSLEGAGLDARPPVTQRDTLLALGIEDFDRRLRAEHDEAAATGAGAAAVRALSRRHALRALLDPGGLGGMQVMVGTKSVAWRLEVGPSGSRVE